METKATWDKILCGEVTWLGEYFENIISCSIERSAEVAWIEQRRWMWRP